MGASGEDSSKRNLLVKLKYRTDEFVVSESDCEALNNVQVDESRNEYERGASSLPKVLETVLSGALRLGTLVFSARDSDDIKDDNGNFLICRSSFFNQIRYLAAQVENAFRIEGQNLVASFHKHDDLLDLQLVYSEKCLDLIFETFGGLRVNTSEMLEMLQRGVDHHKEGETDSTAIMA